MKALYLFSCLILSSCSVSSIPSFDSISSSLIESAEESSIKSKDVESNDLLRNLFASFSSNKAQILYDDQPIRCYYGEAMETLNEGNLITSGEQGIFQWAREPMLSKPVIGRFVEEGKVSSKWGLRKMVSDAANRFVSTSSNEFRWNVIEDNPFIEELLSWKSDVLLEEIISIKLKIEDLKTVYLSLLYSLSFGVENEEVFKIAHIGETLDDGIDEYISNPATLNPPEGFTNDFIGQFAKAINSICPLPFPLGITYAFYEQVEERKMSWNAYGVSLVETYSAQLIDSGFKKISDNVFKLAIYNDDSTWDINTSLKQKDGWTRCYVSIDHKKQSASSFGFINSILEETDYPNFPLTSLLLEASIQQMNELDYEIEATFITDEAGITYFEEYYWPKILSNGYKVIKQQQSGPEIFKTASNGKQEIYIDYGKGNPSKGFNYLITLHTK